MGKERNTPNIDLNPVQDEIMINLVEVYPETLSIQALMNNMQRARSLIYRNLQSLHSTDLVVETIGKTGNGKNGDGRPINTQGANPAYIDDVSTYLVNKYAPLDNLTNK